MLPIDRGFNDAQIFVQCFHRRTSIDAARRPLLKLLPDTDNELIMSIAAAIEAALNRAENQRTGLKARIADVLSRAAIVAGNDLDDYLTRAEDRSMMLNNSDAEIRRAGKSG